MFGWLALLALLALCRSNIETKPVQNVADLRSVRRRPVVTGLINEYHHAA
jgi:hypothetical protein